MSKVKWTNEQLQAIEKTGNNILVAAAAGSGKTAVLVERIINKIIFYVFSSKLSPHSRLCLNIALRPLV